MSVSVLVRVCVSASVHVHVRAGGCSCPNALLTMFSGPECLSVLLSVLSVCYLSTVRTVVKKISMMLNLPLDVSCSF